MFSNVFDVEFTARLETQLDRIETGKDAWSDVVSEFYKPFQSDLTDIAYPPWHAQNRGNLGYKPAFSGDVPSKEATAALKAMAIGELKIGEGQYDNVTGNPAFSDPIVLNPPWRWDATGRQTQWVRP